MDRREALKRLGAAGAIVVGGSAVLSSRDVAYAASGTCIAVIPDPVEIRITEPSNNRIIRLRYEPGNAPGTTTSYAWSSPQITGVASGPPYGVRISTGAAARQVTLQRRTTAVGGPPTRDWAAGDSYSVLLTVTWSCTGPTREDSASYLVTGTYDGTTRPNVTYPLFPLES